MELSLEQHPPTSNRPYETRVDVEEILRRAQVGARFEQSLEMEDGLLHAWPSDRLALAGCKLQVAVKLNVDPEHPTFPATPQNRWPSELANKLVERVKLSIETPDDSVLLLQGKGSDFPCEARQYYPSVGCPQVTFSAVWTFPISAPIPLYTALQANVTATPFEQWQIEKIALIPQYQVIEPVEKASTLLERWQIHRRSAKGVVRVPLTKPPKRVEFETSTPFKRATLLHQGNCLLSLSDRVIADGKIDLQGLDCSGCELEIELDPNDHLKYGGDRAADLAALGFGSTSEKTFTVRLVTEQALVTSPHLNYWQ